MADDDPVLRDLAELQKKMNVVEAKLTDSAVPPEPEPTWEGLFAHYGEPVPTDGNDLRVCDHVAASIAGLGGGLLDLRPRIEAKMTNEDWHQAIDKRFKQKAKAIVGDGNVAIDNAVGGGDGHRLVGPTHDLLRFFQSIKALKEGKFTANVKGVHKVLERYRGGFPPYLKVEKTSDAVFLLLLHWSADFFSKRSLPIPGWSKLAESEDREFVTLLFRAYREGANLRTLVAQFISNLSGLALISIVLHLYRYFDMFFVSATHQFSLGALGLRDDYRFRMMSRNANLIALGVSTANVSVTQNIVAWNYMAFFKFCADGRKVNQILAGRERELDEQVDKLLGELEGEA